MSRGFGVTAGLDPAVAEPLAGRCEMLGYVSMWSNDHPPQTASTPSPPSLARFPASTWGRGDGARSPHARRHRRRIEELGLPPDRLWVGVGAGFSERPLTRMREALPELRAALPDVRLVLADGSEDVRPRWVRLRRRVPQLDDARARRPGAGVGPRGSPGGGPQPPPVLGYVRMAVGPDAKERLRKEESFYRELHDGYRRHFERLGAEPGTSASRARAPLPRPSSPLRGARRRRRPRAGERHRRGDDRRSRRRSPPGARRHASADATSGAGASRVVVTVTPSA